MRDPGQRLERQRRHRPLRHRAPRELADDVHHLEVAGVGAAEQVVLAPAAPFRRRQVGGRHLAHVAERVGAGRGAGQLAGVDEQDEPGPAAPVVGADHVGGVEDDGVEAVRDALAHLLLGAELRALVVDPRARAALLGALVDDAAVLAVGRDARGVDQAPGPALERRPHHVARALDVVAGLLGVAPRPQVEVGGDMKDHVDALGHGRGDRGRIGDVADDADHLGEAREVAEVGGGAVQRHHPPTLPAQPLHQVEPDEAGGAGDESGLGHGASLPIPRWLWGRPDSVTRSGPGPRPFVRSRRP